MITATVAALVAPNPFACNQRPRPAWSPSEIRCVARIVFGPTSSAAIRVAICESGLTAREVSPTSDYGTWQINRPSHPDAFRDGPGRMLHPVWNARYAFRLSRGGTDWRPWACGWAA